MIRFKSITTRVISLHVIAIGITSICMPLALYWLLNSTANDLHHGALRDHAGTIAQYLVRQPGGGWALELPAGLRELYSESYGRLGYAVLDGHGRVLFSSLDDGAAIFPNDRRAAPEQFIETRRGNAVIYGASLAEAIGGETVWIQVAAGSRPSRRADRRHRRRLLPARRLDHLADPAGAADDRHRHLPPRAAPGAAGLGHGADHRPGAHRGAPADAAACRARSCRWSRR